MIGVGYKDCHSDNFLPIISQPGFRKGGQRSSKVMKRLKETEDSVVVSECGHTYASTDTLTLTLYIFLHLPGWVDSKTLTRQLCSKRTHTATSANSHMNPYLFLSELFNVMHKTLTIGHIKNIEFQIM